MGLNSTKQVRERKKGVIVSQAAGTGPGRDMPFLRHCPVPFRGQEGNQESKAPAFLGSRKPVLSEHIIATGAASAYENQRAFISPLAAQYSRRYGASIYDKPGRIFACATGACNSTRRRPVAPPVLPEEPQEGPHRAGVLFPFSSSLGYFFFSVR